MSKSTQLPLYGDEPPIANPSTEKFALPSGPGTLSRPAYLAWRVLSATARKPQTRQALVSLVLFWHDIDSRKVEAGIAEAIRAGYIVEHKDGTLMERRR